MAEADKSQVGLCGLAVMGQVSHDPIRPRRPRGSSLGIAAAPEKSILTAALLCFLANNSPASPVRRTLP